MVEVLASLQHWDEGMFLDLQRLLHQIDGSELADLMRLGGAIGNGWSIAVLGIAVLLAGTTAKARVVRLLDTATCHGIAALFVRFLKGAVERPRPRMALPEAFADGRATLALGEHAMHNAWPSGHTTTVFVTLTLLVVWRLEIAGRASAVVYALSLLPLAVLAGVSRIYTGMHFPLDVVSGAVLGAVLTVLIYAGRRRFLGQRLDPRPTHG